MTHNIFSLKLTNFPLTSHKQALTFSMLRIEKSPKKSFSLDIRWRTLLLLCTSQLDVISQLSKLFDSRCTCSQLRPTLRVWRRVLVSEEWPNCAKFHLKEAKSLDRQYPDSNWTVNLGQKGLYTLVIWSIKAISLKLDYQVSPRPSVVKIDFWQDVMQCISV